MSPIHVTFCVPWLLNKAANTYTQFGEDGLIAACLERIGETNRQCFEVGAADGLFFSNTLRLREQGWSAVLIESDQKQFAKLDRDYGRSAICIHANATDLDNQIPKQFSRTPDLGVIDIDGQDYWLWHDMVDIRPRVMLVEIFPPHDAEPIPKRGALAGQTGLDAIKALGIDKGYTLVATTLCNAIFIETKTLNA